jgi:hypothetical protein
MGRDPCGRRKPGAPGNRSGVSNGEKHLTLIRKGFKDGFLSAILLETDSSNAPYPPKMHPVFQKCTLSPQNAPRFSGMHPTLRKMHPAFSEMHPEKSKMHPSLFLGCIFYQNMSTKP